MTVGVKVGGKVCVFCKFGGGARVTRGEWIRGMGIIGACGQG